MSARKHGRGIVGILVICFCIILFSKTVEATTEWVYQENATSYACSGSWDATYTCAKTYDANWTSYGQSAAGSTAYVELNYTKPDTTGYNVTNATWNIKYAGSYFMNLTFTAECWGQSPLQLRMKSNQSGADYGHAMECWNGTGFFPLVQYTGTNVIDNDIQEEAVYWLTNHTGAWYEFRAYDEETLEQLTFNVTFNNGTNVTTYGNYTLFEKYFTILPQGENTLNFVNASNVTPSGYSVRSYYVAVGNITSPYVMNAYLLKTGSSALINFIVVNNLGSGINGALVTIQKFINSEWETVAQGKTDSTGNTGIYLNYDTTYKITVTATGYSTHTSTIMPTNPPYRITLLRSGIGTYKTQWSWITYSMLPWRSLVAGTVENVTFIINSKNSDLEYYGLNITFNGSVVYSGNDSSNPDGGSLTGSVDLTGVGERTQVSVKGYFKKADDPEQSVVKTYMVFVGTPGNYSLINIVPLVENDLPIFERSLIALLITGFIIVGVAGAVGAGYGLGFIGLGSLGIFTYFQWFDMTWMIMTGVLVVGLYLWRG